jgi:replicative DNA helicase
MSEFRLLNGLIKNPNWIKDSRIHEDILFHTSAKSIFTAIDYHIQNDLEISFSSLFEKANEIDFNVDKDVVSFVINLDNESPKLDLILDNINKGTKKFLLKKKVSSLLESLSSHEEVNSEEVSSIMFEMNDILSNSFDKSLLKSTKDWTDEYLSELIERKTGKIYSFGDPHLDKYLTRKASPGQFILIAGATGTGKSAYALNLVNGFINLNIPSIYISLEMDGISTMDRLVAMRTEIPVEYLYQHGTDLDPIIKKFKEEKTDLEASKSFFFVEDPNLSLIQIQAIIREFKQRTGHKYVLVICDLVTMVKDFQEVNGNKSLANTIELSVNRLNAICKDENICFMGVGQFNRNADSARVSQLEDLELLRPQLNHVKNSHALAERCRVLLSAFRPTYYAQRYLSHLEEVKDMEDILEIQILKQSQGNVGAKMRYLFEGEIMKITPVEYEEDEDGKD